MNTKAQPRRHFLKEFSILAGSTTFLSKQHHAACAGGTPLLNPNSVASESFCRLKNGS
jgi:hypothetical protein